MKKKLLNLLGCLAALLVGAATLVGCGATEPVTFGRVSNTYDGKNYTIAASTWNKVEAAEGFDGAYELTGDVAYNGEAGAILGYPAGQDNTHFVAIKFVAASGVKVEEPTYFVDNNQLTPFDDKNSNELVLIKRLASNSKNFTVTIKWNKDTTVKYSFNVEKAIADGKLAEAPKA